MSKRSTRSSDPGTSAWWLVLPLAGAIAGAAVPLLSALGGVWSVLGPLSGSHCGRCTGTQELDLDAGTQHADRRGT